MSIIHKSLCTKKSLECSNSVTIERKQCYIRENVYQRSVIKTITPIDPACTTPMSPCYVCLAFSLFSDLQYENDSFKYL